MDYPKISVWITSTGRFEFLRTTINSFLEHNTYPNIEWLIFESIPTEESLQYFNTPLMNTDRCLEYLKEVKDTVPKDTDMRIWAEPWPPFGNVLSKFLTVTNAEYYICLEDDCLCVCDPKEQWLDGIELLKDDPNLLGFRNDLSNPTVDETDKRFVGVKRHPISDYLYWPTAGGATFVDVDKMQSIGGYPMDHPLKDFWTIERAQNEAMVNHGMYMGVMLKYFGSFAHIGHTEVTGRDRAWSKKIYMDMVNAGHYGRRDK